MGNWIKSPKQGETHVEMCPSGTVRVGHGSTTKLTGKVITISPESITLDFEKVDNNIPTCLQIYNVKYSGSSLHVQYSELCINDIEINDAGVYQLKATSATETVYSNQVTLDVFGDPAFSLTKKENNFLRCYLLCHRIGTESVRLFFNSYVPETTLISHLNTYRCDLAHGNPRKGIQKCTTDQLSVLYPANTSGVVRSINFDFCLLYKLIRNTINVSPPSKGWGCQPSQSDTTGSDDVERVRQSRNKLAHNTTFEMSETEFHEFWNELSLAISRLSTSLLVADIKELLTKMFDRHQKNKMLEDLQTNFKQMLQEMKELHQDVADCQRNLRDTKNDIAVNKVQINNILDTHIPQNVRAGHLKQLQKWRTDDSVYYETHAYESAKDVVFSNTVVTCVGGPGSGKTALMQHIALHLENEGWEVVPVCKPEEILSYANPNFRQIFLLNDVFGIFCLDMHLYNNIVNHTDRIFSALGKQSKVLLTCRTQVYKEVYNLRSAIMENIVDLQSVENELNGSERTEILARHCNSKNVKKAIYQSLSLESAKLMFPLLCKLFSSEKQYHQFGEKFFSQPIDCLLSELERLHGINKIHYSALVLCLLSGNAIFDINMIDKDIKNEIYNTCGVNLGTSDRQISDALLHMTGSYILNTNKCYKFIHDSIYEVIAYHYGKDFPQQILKYMPSSYIASNVVVCKDLSHNLCIELNEDLYPELARRLYEDVKNLQLYDVFMNKSLSSSKFIFCFSKILKEKPYLEFIEFFLSKQNLNRHIYFEVNKWDSSSEEIKFQFMSTERERQQLLVDYKCRFPDERTYCIRTISWIIYYGHYHILQQIVDYVAAQNDSTDLIFGSGTYEQTRLLTLGCFSGSLDIVKLILNYVKNRCIDFDLTMKYVKRAFVERVVTPLAASCSLGHLSIVDLLVRNKANINLKNTYGLTPLGIAIFNGHFSVVDYLVRNGADTNVVDCNKRSLLHIASIYGYYDISKYLIDCGAKVNICDNDGRSPLYLASNCGELEVVKLLIANSANVNICDTLDSSPLHEAIIENRFDIAKELLDNGANVNLCDYDNKSPLYMASSLAYSQLVKLLLQNEANVSIHDNYGVSPLDLALLSNSADILKDLVRGENKLSTCQGNYHLFQVLVDLRRLEPPCDIPLKDISFGGLVIFTKEEPPRLWNAVWKIITEKSVNDLKYLFQVGLNPELGKFILHRFIRCTHVPEKLQKLRLLLEDGTSDNIRDDEDNCLLEHIKRIILLQKQYYTKIRVIKETRIVQRLKEFHNIILLVRKFERRKSV